MGSVHLCRFFSIQEDRRVCIARLFHFESKKKSLEATLYPPLHFSLALTMTSVVGIDLGYQNSLIAAAGRGGVDVLLNGNSQRLNPYVCGCLFS
jgi:Hsp70 protein